MKIDKSLKDTLVKKVLSFPNVSKVYVFEHGGLVNFYIIQSQANSYKDFVNLINETTDLEMEYNSVPLFFTPYDFNQEFAVLNELKSYNVCYEVYTDIRV